VKTYSKKEYGIFFIYVLIGSVALGLRVYLAGIAYPAQLDVPAIIAQGIMWAQGHPEGMGSIYPEIPVLVSAYAYRLGLNPAEILQSLNVIYGTMVVLLTMIFAQRLFGRHSIAWIAGGLTTTIDGLLSFSVNSMPETGFGMCLMGACAIMAGPIRGSLTSPVVMGIGYAFLGIGMYFRPVETLVSLTAVTGWLFLCHLSHWKKAVLHISAGLLFAVVILAPYYLKAKSAEASEDRIAFNIKSIAFGDLAYDGKQIHDPDRQVWKDEMTQEVLDLGLHRWLWEHRAEVSKRYLKNLLRCARSYSEYIFTNAFRLGNAWFVMLLVLMGCSAVIGENRRNNIFLALMLVSLPAGVSLGYVFNRYLLAYLPFLVIMISAFVVNSPVLWGSTSKRVLWTIVLLSMMTQSSAVTIHGHKDQQWSWDNLRDIAQTLKGMVPADKRIIAPQDTFMIEFDPDNPLRCKKFPYSEPDRFENYAANRNVSHIVLCSTQKSNYPMNAVFDGQPPPPNWTMILERKYQREHPVWGPQEEIYRIYERIDASDEK